MVVACQGKYGGEWVRAGTSTVCSVSCLSLCCTVRAQYYGRAALVKHNIGGEDLSHESSSTATKRTNAPVTALVILLMVLGT